MSDANTPHESQPHPSTDSELEQLRAEMAYSDERAKHQRDLKEIETRLKRLERPDLPGAASVLLFQRRYWQREHQRKLLLIELLDLPREIKKLKQQYEAACSPGIRNQHERSFIRRQAGRALGGGAPHRGTIEPSLGPYPEESIRAKLVTAEAALKVKQEKLQKLRESDPEWVTQLAQIPPVSLAPRPVSVVKGSWIPPKPKPAEVPSSFPPGLPPSLELQTKIILAETVKAMPDRSKLEQICKHLVSRLAEPFCKAVRNGDLKAEAAPDQLNEVLHYFRVANCKNANERYRIETAVQNSDEWYALLKRLLDREASVDTAIPEATLSPAIGFTHSADYRTITFQAKSYCLTTQQAIIVGLLHDAWKHGVPGVSKTALLDRIGSPASRIRDSFRSADGLELWGKLVIKVPRKQDMYTLNLSKQELQLNDKTSNLP